MCGITGFCDFNKKTGDEVLTNMTDSLRHRGPEDSGIKIWHESNYSISFGHRRLAIIDISKRGHQPMSFCNRTITYNGEVYNFKEIRCGLVEKGISFESDSDTEVVLKSFVSKGIEALREFNGMFVFAIYDQYNQTLTIGRDKAGVKPVFYYYKDGLFLFASELKAIYLHPRFEKEMNVNGLALYLDQGYIPTPYSIFQHTFKLEPGHLLTLDLKTKILKKEKYWDIIDVYNQPKLDISENEALIHLEKLLRSSCQYRMIADVPVGVFLSGGYDSSLVAALAQDTVTTKIKTFTIGFTDNEFNEAEHAKKIANYLGTDHVEHYCSVNDVADILPKFPEIYDEPFGDSSGILTYMVSRLAKQFVKVSLSGDGAEEVFAGYESYVSHARLNRYLSFSPALMTNTASYGIALADRFGILTRVNNKQVKIKKIRDIWGQEVQPQIDDLVRIKQLLNLPFLHEHTFFYDFHLLKKNIEYADKLLAIDFKTRLLDDFLAKVDRATMAASVESREPLLDHHIIEFMARLPLKLKYKNGIPKYLLKQIAYKYIPKELLDRPKMGFAFPEARWLRNELKIFVNHYFNEERLRIDGIFNVPNVIALKNNYMNNGFNSKNDCFTANKIFFILSFLMWKEKWLK